RKDVFVNFRSTRQWIGRLGDVFLDQVVDGQVFVSQRQDFSRDIFQLTNISRPRVPKQQAHGGLTDFRLLALEKGRISPEEKFEQSRNVFSSISDRGQSQVYPINPVVKLFSKASALHFVFEVSRGRRDHTHAVAAFRRRAVVVG